MLLLKGKKNIGKNISTEMKHGKPQKQAIAIAMSVAKMPTKPMKKHEKKETKKVEKKEHKNPKYKD